MKFLYFTDSHIRGTSPKSRKDDFFETVLKKVDEIFELARLHQVDGILHGGDLFDRPDASLSVVSELALRIQKVGIPFYIISGNHDIYGHNPNTLYRTMLGFLGELGFVDIINDRRLLLEDGMTTVQLSGAPYSFDIDRESGREAYVVRERDPSCDFAIHLCHGFLTDTPKLPEIPHTTINRILDTKADITLCGHVHHGFPPQNIDGKRFINPGAIVRISNSTMEISRRPKVLLLQLTKGEEPVIENIYLKSAKPGEEVLDRTEIEQHRFKKMEMAYFKEAVDSSGNFHKTDVFELLREIAEKEHLPEATRQKALEYIAEVQMEDSL